MRAQRGLRLSIWIISTVLCGSVSAQERQFGWGNYRTVLLGGPTAAMGGTGVAAGTDSAMPYLNPAGLAAVGRHHISMSASVYALTALDVSDLHSDGLPMDHPGFGKSTTVGPFDEYRSQHVDAFPSSFVYSWPMGPGVGQTGHHVFSISILTPYRAEERWQGQFNLEFQGQRNSNTIAHHVSRSTYQIGPSYAVQLSPSLRMGTTLGLLYQGWNRVFESQWAQTAGREFNTQISTTSTQGYALEFKPILGLQWAANQKLSLGFALAAPTIHMASAGQGITHLNGIRSQGLVFDGAMPTTFLDVAIDADQAGDPQPMSVSAGVAYSVKKRWSLAADIHYHHSMDTLAQKGTETRNEFVENGLDTRTVRRFSVDMIAEPVVNGSLGFRFYPTDAYAVNLGAFTDFSANPTLRSSVDVLRRRVDRYGLTGGCTFFFGPVDFTVGAAYIYGEGQFAAFEDFLSSVTIPGRSVPISTHQITGFITGGVSFGDAIKPIAKISDLPLNAAAAFFTQKDPLSLKLGDVHPSFQGLAGGPLDDLKRYVTAKGAVPGIAYEQVGVAEYDRFFKEAAIVEGALVIAGGRLQSIGRGIAQLKRATVGVVTGVEMATSDAGVLRLVGAYGAALHTIDMKKALKAINRDREVALKAISTLMDKAPAVLQLGMRLLSELPKRFKTEGMSALASTAIALRNSIRMVRRFKKAVKPVVQSLKALWPKGSMPTSPNVVPVQPTPHSPTGAQ